MKKKKSRIFKNLKEIIISNVVNIKDTRRQRSDLKYSFKDIILGAFSLFYFQNSSWLQFQTQMQTKSGQNNANTLFDIEDIAVDNHITDLTHFIIIVLFRLYREVGWMQSTTQWWDTPTLAHL